MSSLPKLSTFALALFMSPAFAFSQDRLRDVIDQRIETAWKTNNVTPAEPSTDAEFMRRVYLDLLGVIPSYDEAIAFLDDASSDKREKLTDRLIEDPRFARHQAEVWDQVPFRTPRRSNTL